MAKKLKKGATEFFKDLEKIINEIFGFGEEVADHGLTPSEKRYKDKLKAQQERIERKNRRKSDDVEIGGVSKKLSSIWKTNLKEGKYNCANCVIATDATLAGRPASALPYTIQKRFRNGKWENYASYRRGTEPKVLETEFGAKFSDWATNLDDLVKDLKPGKRGVVFGYKKGADVGHVFNVVNEKGVIKYLDGQTGKRAKLVYDQYKFLPTN